MIAFMDDHRATYGVEPICRVLPLAPSTYYDHVAKRVDPAKRSARAKRDMALKADIRRVFADNFAVYGARKVWRQLRREGHGVARCTVERLMRAMGKAGQRFQRRSRWNGQTRAARRSARQAGPNNDQRQGGSLPAGSRQSPLPGVPAEHAVGLRLHLRGDLAGLHLRGPFGGSATGCFAVGSPRAIVIDVFARRIVGWRVGRTAHASFVLDALEQALHDRHPVRRSGLVHHSDRGSQYVSIKYTERLAAAGIEPSVGSVGDSYDNALAETINGLYKTEVIRRRGPWKSLEAVELATLEWVEWFNHRRLLGPIGNIPPVEAEQRFFAEVARMKTAA